MSVPFNLSSTEDAIRLGEIALGNDDLVAIVDGDARMVMPFSGVIPDDAVLQIDELLRLASEEHPGNRLVLVSRRHRGPSFVLETELERWRAMQAAHAGHVLPLLDWLVFLDDGTVLSLAEIAGPPPMWE